MSYKMAVKVIKQRSGISELLEIVFHYILYAKKIYPEEIFDRKMTCYLPIWKCKNRDVSSYILNFLMFLEKLLGVEPSLEVAFLIIGKCDEVVEEFSFDIQYPKEHENGKIRPKFRLDELLATIALALNCVSSSDSECQGKTFELQVRSDCVKVRLGDIIDDLRNKDFPWIAIKNPCPEYWTNVVPLQTLSNSRFKIRMSQYQRVIEVIDIA